jgi:membrane protease YdiL (CAAX protease family)
MWGPGIATVVATVFIARKGWKEGLKELGLGRFGRFRFYLFAWFLPPLVVVLTILLTLLLRLGKYDADFTYMREALAGIGREDTSPQKVIIAQFIQALLFGPLVNVLFSLGEEIGWRGFLLPRLLPLGQWQAILISGAVWGLWHAPAIVQGLNYPKHPIAGIPMMVVFCILSGVFLGWLYLKTRSSWVAALAHGSMNAWGGMPFTFLVPGFNLLLGGTVPSLTGWIVLSLFIGLLIVMKQLPGPDIRSKLSLSNR